MPIYVLHGFRWPRTPIRQFIIVNDINEAASDYIMQNTTPNALQVTMKKLYPDIMARLQNLQFIEQHDPENPATQEFGFVADVVVESNAYVDIDKIREQGPKPAAWEAFMDLKEELHGFALKFDPTVPDFPVGWYVSPSIPADAPTGAANHEGGVLFADIQIIKYRYAVYNGDPERYQDRLESSGNSGDDGPATEVCSATILTDASTR